MPKLTFVPTGASYDVADGTSYLEYCQEHAIDHPFGCTVGSCGTCRCEVVEGADNVTPITDEESETVEMCTDVPGARLGCQLKLHGDVSIRPVD